MATPTLTIEETWPPFVVATCKDCCVRVYRYRCLDGCHYVVDGIHLDVSGTLEDRWVWSIGRTLPEAMRPILKFLRGRKS